MLSNRKTPWLALAALSIITAYGLWQIAIRQPDRVQVRFIDLPPVTEAALLTSGIDRQTTTEFMEVRTALGRIKPAMTQISSLQTRERNDGHSRAGLTKEPNEENLSVSQAERSQLGQDQADSGSVLESSRPYRGSGPVIAGEIGRADRAGNVGDVGNQVSRLQRSRVGGRAVIKGEQASPKVGQWVKVEISTYSRSYHGNGTHGGERYDHYSGHTAATTIIGKRWVLPKGSTWEVEYLGKTITVRINDTGSWRPKRAPYWLDLSGAAWRDLTGIAPSRKVARMRRVR